MDYLVGFFELSCEEEIAFLLVFINLCRASTHKSDFEHPENETTIRARLKLIYVKLLLIAIN